LALLGLVFGLGLFIWVKTSRAARFLAGVVFLTLFLLYTPPGAALTAAIITRRMLFRLSWVFPWGLTIAFFVTRIRSRRVVTWLIILGLALAMGRGDPRNYVKSLRSMRARNRPSSGAVAAFEFLAGEPSPQGVVLASETTGRMIAGFLPEAYPVNFREYGPVGREQLKQLMALRQIDAGLLEEIARNRVRYVLLENTQPLAQALDDGAPSFVPRYRNESHSVWEVRAQPEEAGLEGYGR
jgi:hypothetical protein